MFDYVTNISTNGKQLAILERELARGKTDILYSNINKLGVAQGSSYVQNCTYINLYYSKKKTRKFHQGIAKILHVGDDDFHNCQMLQLKQFLLSSGVQTSTPCSFWPFLLEPVQGSKFDGGSGSGSTHKNGGKLF